MISRGNELHIYIYQPLNFLSQKCSIKLMSTVINCMTTILEGGVLEFKRQIEYLVSSAVSITSSSVKSYYQIKKKTLP